MTPIRTNVGTVASRVVVTATAELSISEAAQLMRRHHVGTLVVVQSGGAGALPIGIVTDRDLVVEVLAQGIDPNRFTVAEVMSPTPVTAREDDALFEAVDAMRRRGVRRLVVVDAVGRLVGLLSMDDVLAVLADELSGLARATDVEQSTEQIRRPERSRAAAAPSP